MGGKNIYTILFLESVKKFISKLSAIDSAKVAAAITIIEQGELHLLEIKTLKTPIKKLKIKKYRLLFFILNNLVYFIHAFAKKTAKTPKKEIEYAEKIYKIIINK